jgi:hypothetical protein
MLPAAPLRAIITFSLRVCLPFVAKRNRGFLSIFALLIRCLRSGVLFRAEKVRSTHLQPSLSDENDFSSSPPPPMFLPRHSLCSGLHYMCTTCNAFDTFPLTRPALFMHQ